MCRKRSGTFSKRNLRAYLRFNINYLSDTKYVNSYEGRQKTDMLKIEELAENENYGMNSKEFKIGNKKNEKERMKRME